jgi:hypothetical protein
MHHFSEEIVPWVSGATATAPDKHLLAIAPRAADAIVGFVPSKKAEAASPRDTSALASDSLTYGPLAAVTACLFGVSWLVGSHSVGPTPPLVQQESVQSVAMGNATQKVAEGLHAQKADVEATRTAQKLSPKDATGPGNAKPRLE